MWISKKKLEIMLRDERIKTYDSNLEHEQWQEIEKLKQQVKKLKKAIKNGW